MPGRAPSLGGPGFGTAAQVDALVRRGAEALPVVPGVAVVGASCGPPFENGFGLPIRNRRPRAPRGQSFHGGGGWLAVLTGLLRGSEDSGEAGARFKDRDGNRNPAVVVINEIMARQYWPNANPVGERVVLGDGIGREFQDEPPREIVGIVGGVRVGRLDATPREPGSLVFAKTGHHVVM